MIPISRVRLETNCVLEKLQMQVIEVSELKDNGFQRVAGILLLHILAKHVSFRAEIVRDKK